MEKWNTLSYSQMSSHSTCARKYELEYVHRLRLKRGDVQQSSLGDLVHHGIAAALKQFWNYQVSFPDVIRNKGIKKGKLILVSSWQNALKYAAREAISTRVEQSLPVIPVLQLEGTEVSIEATWSALADDASLIVNNLIDELDLFNNYRVAEAFIDNGERLIPQPVIEFALSAELTDNARFSGVVDAVLFNIATGQYELIDWKVRSRFTTYENEVLNGQLALYQHVLGSQYNIDVPTAITYQIKNKAPRKPGINKNGSMSRQAIVSTWAIYENALLEVGLNPDDYRDEMQPKLSGVQFFEPIRVTRLPVTTQNFWDNAVAFANVIANQTQFPMALGYPCRSCAFAQLCTARMMGYNEEELIEAAYEVRPSDIRLIDEEED